jgi:type III pantothenate kinase
MLLAIDIGNTNISLGLFYGRRLLKRYTIPTKEKKYYPRLNKLLRSKKKVIKDIILCSVVPKSSDVLAKGLKKLLGRKPIIIGKSIKVPLKNLYRKPEQVGQDRLVNAYAATALYGAPLVAVDFGTAITFDVISKDEEYLGGMIVPGLGISLEALAEKTALLPKIKLAKPKEFIGGDTRASMLSGIIYGFAALTDVLVSRIKERIGKNALVIGTGGNIALIGKYCRKIDRIDPDLTLKGLNLIARGYFSMLGMKGL